MRLSDLNLASDAEARDHFIRCCGSSAWADGMVRSRPFGSIEELFGKAGEIWIGLGEKDWLEAFAAHPRIGATGPVSDWSAREQSGMKAAASDTKAQMAELNQKYFDKFGFVFLICATGKSADEMLAQIKLRYGRSRGEEIATARIEQDKITRIRLEKLLCEV